MKTSLKFIQEIITAGEKTLRNGDFTQKRLHKFVRDLRIAIQKLIAQAYYLEENCNNYREELYRLYKKYKEIGGIDQKLEKQNQQESINKTCIQEQSQYGFAPRPTPQRKQRLLIRNKILNRDSSISSQSILSQLKVKKKNQYSNDKIDHKQFINLQKMIGNRIAYNLDKQKLNSNYFHSSRLGRSQSIKSLTKQNKISQDIEILKNKFNKLQILLQQSIPTSTIQLENIRLEIHKILQKIVNDKNIIHINVNKKINKLTINNKKNNNETQLKFERNPYLNKQIIQAKI